MSATVASEAHTLTPKGQEGSIPSPATNGRVAQSVEHWIENPGVGGSSPPLSTIESEDPMETDDVPMWWRVYVWELVCAEALWLHKGMPVAGFPWGQA